MLIKRRDGQGGLPARPGKRRGGPPPASDAYEDNWYRVLARMAETKAPPASADRAAAEEDGSGTAPSRLAPHQDGALDETRPPELILPPIDRDDDHGASSDASSTGLVQITGPLPPPRTRPAEDRRSHAKGSAPAIVERPRVIHSNVRIGVRKVADPEEIYVEYLTRSPHADYFRSDWWPGGRTLTPVHLWRANHLGAGWDLEAVRRFMAEPAAHAERMLGAAPRRDAPGAPARRVWFRRLLEQEWVHEFGVPRIAKTLHPLAPELVPSLDPLMTPWATAEWFGLHDEGADPVEGWLDVWELLEDALVLRGEVLSDIVRSSRERAPGRAPMGRLGLINAAFWDAYWRERPEPARPARAPRRTEPASPRTKRETAARAGGPRGKRSASAHPSQAKKAARAKTTTPDVAPDEAPRDAPDASPARPAPKRAASSRAKGASGTTAARSAARKSPSKDA